MRPHRRTILLPAGARDIGAYQRAEHLLCASTRLCNSPTVQVSSAPLSAPASQFSPTCDSSCHSWLSLFGVAGARWKLRRVQLTDCVQYSHHRSAVTACRSLCEGRRDVSSRRGRHATLRDTEARYFVASAAHPAPSQARKRTVLSTICGIRRAALLIGHSPLVGVARLSRRASLWISRLPMYLPCGRPSRGPLIHHQRGSMPSDRAHLVSAPALILDGPFSGRARWRSHNNFIDQSIRR